MPNFTVDQIRGMMDRSDRIRNISVIAHVDHGKSTLTDSLIGHAGIIAEKNAGDTRFMDTRADEQDRTITIKSTAVSLHFSLRKEDCPPVDQKLLEESKSGEETVPYLINLIDSPGHVDFSSEVTAALRVTDGALVVVDCIEGVSVQTETVLRQAIQERIRPVLFVNKLDRVFLELHMDHEEAYQNFSRAVGSVNVTISQFSDETMEDSMVDPTEANVGFGSGLHGWGFTIRTFAKMYAAKTGNVGTWMKRLWGEKFYDSHKDAKKKWRKKQDVSGRRLERGFCRYIMKPIQDLFDAIMNKKTAVYERMFEKLNIVVPKDAKDLVAKPLLKRVMQTWLPAAESLLYMIVRHLPSPVTAQKYRVGNLYHGPSDDEAYKGIANCDPKAGLMMYVSKMVPTSDKGRFYAFGRVFSGTIAPGVNVRIMGSNYKPGSKKDLYIKKIQRVVLMMGRYIEQLADCPAGNIVGLVGVDQYLLKAGTISTIEEAHAIVTMKYSVSPVVRVAVNVKNASDLPKLSEGLKRLMKSDPLVQITQDKDTGEHIIAGAGELHLEICIKDLREDFMKGAPITIGKPVVSYCETVTKVTEKDCIGKSPNKHNRVYMRAEPLTEEFNKALEDGDVNEDQDSKLRGKTLIKDFGWTDNDARKIWAFGVQGECVANVLVDQTSSIAYLNEVKDHINSAFKKACHGGVLARERFRGIRFNIKDVTLHPDAIHRGAGQMMPPTRRSLYACQLGSGPAFVEPMYLCDITVPVLSVTGVYSTLSARRGQVDGQEDMVGTPLTRIKAFLPVAESFGFTELLRRNTSGKAFPQMSFHHWDPVPGDCLNEEEVPYGILMSIRERKGLKAVAPKFGDYHDKV